MAQTPPRGISREWRLRHNTGQSGLSLTFPRHRGNTAVPRYFVGPYPVSANDCGRFKGLRGRRLHGPILTNGFAGSGDSKMANWRPIRPGNTAWEADVLPLSLCLDSARSSDRFKQRSHVTNAPMRGWARY